MPRRLTSLIVLLLSALLLPGGSAPADLGRQGPPAARRAPAAQPLAFEPNAGQADPGTRFLAHVPTGLLLFAPDGLTLQVRRADCQMRSKGLNAQFAPAATITNCTD